MIKSSTAMLSAAGLALMALPATLSADTLSLPADARLAVTVIDSLTVDSDTPQRDDILLRPVSGSADATHELPEYCVLVADARLDGERVRVTTQSLTCIETQDADSNIFSGELSAAAYEADGSYGIDVCDDGGCEVTPEHVFQLQLASPLEVEEQANPSAEINEQRREASGEGVANPIPASRPDPDDE